MEKIPAYRAPSIRVHMDNPNHHIWDNNGTWFIHYTLYPSAYRKKRIRRSLRTKDIVCARQSRDRILARYADLIIYNEPKKIAA
jgi:hypothetical protein